MSPKMSHEVATHFIDISQNALETLVVKEGLWLGEFLKIGHLELTGYTEEYKGSAFALTIWKIWPSFQTNLLPSGLTPVARSLPVHGTRLPAQGCVKTVGVKRVAKWSFREMTSVISNFLFSPRGRASGPFPVPSGMSARAQGPRGPVPGTPCAGAP